MAAFGYNISITGDCFNTGVGAIHVSLSGGVEPYIIDFVTPSLGTGSTKTGLVGGAYIIRVNDSLGDVNNEFYVNAIVSSGGCLNVTSVSATTCGENNGSVTITGSSTAFPTIVKLFSGNTLIQSGTTVSPEITFTSLAGGIYEAYFEDSGGCSGYSESVIVLPSTTLDFDFYVVDNTSCYGNVGKVIITGLTGTPPYTYLWEDGSTGTTITGLTADTYNVTVTDASGCEVTKTATVSNAPQLGIASIQSTSPSCFSGNGTVTITVTGGTAPFYYSGSNGSNLITYANTITFSGFSPGISTIVVTDATLCNTQASVYLQAAAGFSVLGISSTNSTCSTSGGTIQVNLQGEAPFTYTLVKPDSSTLQFITNLSNQTFSDLDNGTYSVIVSNDTGCFYQKEVSIYTNDKFDLTVYTTGTTCGYNNGTAYVEVGTGFTGVLDFILSKNNVVNIQYIDIIQSAVTFNGLTSGTYQLQVRDQDNCSVYTNFSIGISETLDFGLTATECGPKNNQGTIVTSIYGGTPPFTYLWSPNLHGFNGPNPVGLSGDTYSVTITDASGCTLTRNVVVPCVPTVSGYQTISVVSDNFTTYLNTERDMSTMLNEGFYELTTGHTNCVLVSAEFIATIEISGNTYTDSFYTGTTITDVPSESLWVDTIEGILSGITGVNSYVVNPTTNQILVKSVCDGTSDELGDSEFITGLIINYDINCET